MENEVIEVCGHHVPQLINHDDNRLIVEMSIVQPPFLLDFASAYLDREPDFTGEVLAEWRAEKAEMFGPKWEHVQHVLAELRHRHGIYLTDVKRGNIEFGEDDSTGLSSLT